MNVRTGWLLAASLLLFPLAASAQSSDAAAVSAWIGRSTPLAGEIAAASTSSELEPIGAKIDALERDFSGRRTLLDAALHPSTFEGTLRSLRSGVGSASAWLRKIEEQEAALARSAAELGETRDRLKRVSASLDAASAERRSLALEIEKLKLREERRIAAIRAYRAAERRREEAEASAAAASAASRPAAGAAGSRSAAR